MAQHPLPPDLPTSPAIHASAVRTDKGALIFLGPSGTGKSTIYQTLSTHTDATPLANEALYIFPWQDGKWGISNADKLAHQGPPPRAHNPKHEAVPLQAIFRLYQASPPYLKPIGELQTCRYLTDALFEIAWQRHLSVEAKKAVFSDLAAICRLVPGYEFHFDLSQKTVKILCETSGVW